MFTLSSGGVTVTRRDGGEIRVTAFNDQAEKYFAMASHGTTLRRGGPPVTAASAVVFWDGPSISMW